MLRFVTAPGRRPDLAVWVALVVWLVAATLRPVLAEPAPESLDVSDRESKAAADETEPRWTSLDYRGIFSFRAENDIFAGNDNNYSNGIAASWTSAELSTLDPDGFVAKTVDWFAFLPTVGQGGWRDYVGFEVGQEMYTPSDISLPEPPPGDQPYAGVLFFDTKLYTRRASELHTYSWRLGIVGPASLAEQAQRFLHWLIGAQDPEGWDDQLENEPLFNFDYQYHRRLFRSANPTGFGFDVAFNGGAGAGNYYIGANSGAQLRLGHALPDNFGTFDIRRGGEALVGLAPSPTGWHGYGQLQSNLFAIGRFLPVDGNTFRDSLEGERDDFYAVVSAGAVVGYRRLLFSYMYNHVVEKSSFLTKTADDYGSIAVHYFF